MRLFTPGHILHITKKKKSKEQKKADKYAHTQISIIFYFHWSLTVHYLYKKCVYNIFYFSENLAQTVTNIIMKCDGQHLKTLKNFE